VNRIKNILITTIAATTLAACQKSDDTPVQPSKVVTTIESPQQAQVYRKGDTVKIHGNISYVSRLHGYVLRVKSKETGAVYFTAEDHQHSDKFDVQHTWVDTLSGPAELILEVTTEITHEGDTTNATVQFESQP
jgi:hypothetical protein